MIKDEHNRNGYSEEYDILGLEELAKMAMRYVATEDGRYNRIFDTRGKVIPDGSYSDFSCNVWELMTRLVHYGTKLERLRNGECDYGVCDSADQYLNLWYLGFDPDQRISLRE